MEETWVQFLGWKDPLEKGMDGYPLQYSCLETSMNRGAWRATIHGVVRVGNNLATKERERDVVGSHKSKGFCI